MRHDPKRVRLREEDMTFHCAVHGLLDADEARDVLVRAHMTRPDVRDRDMALRGAGPLLRALTRLSDWWALKTARCVP